LNGHPICGDAGEESKGRVRFWLLLFANHLLMISH